MRKVGVVLGVITFFIVAAIVFKLADNASNETLAGGGIPAAGAASWWEYVQGFDCNGNSCTSVMSHFEQIKPPHVLAGVNGQWCGTANVGSDMNHLQKKYYLITWSGGDWNVESISRATMDSKGCNPDPKW